MAQPPEPRIIPPAETIPPAVAPPPAAPAAVAGKPVLGASLWLSMAAAVIGMTAVAVLVTNWQLAPVHAALAQRPAVLVLDLNGALEGLNAEDASARLAALLAMTRRLADNGVLVLDEKAVLAAPPALAVQGMGMGVGR